MSGYVKLYSTIITSSIWLESHATLRVWITMLTLADRRGEVSGSIGGLAHIANVTREECVAALELFMSPDPDSRTPEHEGRRIEKIDGGWLVLNAEKYRDLRTETQVEWAERKKRWRDSKGQSGDNGDMSEDKRIASASASSSTSPVALSIGIDKKAEAEIKPPRVRFLEKFYHDATPERLAEVVRQLDQALNPEGVRVSKDLVVRANSDKHLNKVLSAVLREKPPKDHDKAIVFVLKKLGDPELDDRGRTVTEALSANQSVEDELLPVWDRLRRNAVEAWAKANAEEADSITVMVRRSLGRDQFGFEAKARMELTKAAGFPDFHVWLEQRQTAGANPR